MIAVSFGNKYILFRPSPRTEGAEGEFPLGHPVYPVSRFRNDYGIRMRKKGAREGHRSGSLPVGREDLPEILFDPSPKLENGVDRQGPEQ
jgi:hypothetical protein